MEETVVLTLKIIRFSSLFFIIFALLGFVIFNFTKEKNRLYKNYKLLMPLYYMFFAITVFCGMILLTFKHFALNLNNFFMIVAFCIILATSIKSYKFSKKTELFEKFKSFTCKKFASDIIISLFLIFLTRYFG